MAKKDFYDKNKNLIIISLVFVVFVIIGSCLNKINSNYINNISTQVTEIYNYYSGDISIKNLVFVNIKEYIRYLSYIGILSLFLFTFPLALLVFILKAMSIGYTVNTCVLLFGLKSFKMCSIVFLKNIVIAPVSIILMLLSIEYVKNGFKLLKKKRQDSILSLGKEFLLNLIIIMFISIILQSMINIIGIGIIQFLAR